MVHEERKRRPKPSRGKILEFAGKDADKVAEGSPLSG